MRRAGSQVPQTAMKAESSSTQGTTIQAKPSGVPNSATPMARAGGVAAQCTTDSFQC